MDIYHNDKINSKTYGENYFNAEVSPFYYHKCNESFVNKSLSGEYEKCLSQLNRAHEVLINSLLNISNLSKEESLKDNSVIVNLKNKTQVTSKHEFSNEDMTSVLAQDLLKLLLNPEPKESRSKKKKKSYLKSAFLGNDVTLINEIGKPFHTENDVNDALNSPVQFNSEIQIYDPFSYTFYNADSLNYKEMSTENFESKSIDNSYFSQFPSASNQMKTPITNFWVNPCESGMNSVICWKTNKNLEK